MALDKRGREWSVVDGKAVVTTPAVEATSTPVSTRRMDNQIVRLEKQTERAAAELVTLQARHAALTAQLADLVALRTQVEDDPEPG